MSTLVTTITKPTERSTEAAIVARPRVKFHPVLWDLALTMATEFGVLVAGLVLVSLVGRLLGPVALGEYLLLRRIAAWLVAGVLLGMANALPRYIAHSVTKPERERRAYFLVASLCMVSSASTVGVILYLGRYTFARWLFGNAKLAELILPLILLLAGLAVETAAYGYYRGNLSMRRANAILFFHFAVIPVAVMVLLYPTQSIALIVGVTGLMTVLAAGWFAWPVLRQLATDKLPRLRPYASELLRYGVGRVPGDFGGAALFALGPVIAAHYLPLEQVAYLLLGANFLLLMGYIAGPVSVVFLSKFSMMLAQNRLEDVRRSLEYMTAAVLELSVFACLQLVVFADILVRLWVGPRFLPGIAVIRLLILAIPSYLFFMALRSGIDAVTVKPKNAANVLIALAVYLSLIAVILKVLPSHFLLDSLGLALVVASAVLGVLTARTFRDLYDLRVPWRQCAPALIAGLLLGGLSFAFRWVQGFRQAPVEGFLFMLLVSALFLSALFKLRPPWFGFVWKNGVLRR